jgi:hypothetical protein
MNKTGIKILRMDIKSYSRGVAVGLIIACVTGAIAYVKAGPDAFQAIIEFELVVSAIFLVLSFLIDNKEKP